MGGVLVDLDIEGCKDSFRKNLEYHDIDRIIDPCHQKGIWGDLEEGLLEADEFRRIILADSCPGAGPQDVDEAMARILVGISPYKAELLKRMCRLSPVYAEQQQLNMSAVFICDVHGCRNTSFGYIP